MLRHLLSKCRQLQSCYSFPSKFIPVFYRPCSQSHGENYWGVIYEPDFTAEQKKYLLHVLNESNPDQLSRYNLSKNRIKKIDAWRKKNGCFGSLMDVLDVDGLGVKMLNRLCKTILEANNNEEDVQQKRVKTRGQILTPNLTPVKLKDLKSALGIHLYATGLSWARIERENNSVTHWDFVNYNPNGKKLAPMDALQIVLKLGDEIPTSDIYIFEAPVSVTPTAQQSAISVAAYAQRVQLLSMLMIVLNTSPIHNPTYVTLHSPENQSDANLVELETNVYLLRQRLAARLFRTLIGNERVSAATTIAGILSNDKPQKGLYYTPIIVDNELNSIYDAELPVNKEVMGQALLLTMAFMDVCVYQNAKSIKAISSTRS